MQSESESDDEDAASDYSDDFEDAASSPAPKGKGNATSATNSAGAKPTATAPLNSNKTNTSAATPAAAIAAANVYTGATLAEVKATQDEASREMRERERVLNPLKESLAYSLLASQVHPSATAFLLFLLLWVRVRNTAVISHFYLFVYRTDM